MPEKDNEKTETLSPKQLTRLIEVLNEHGTEPAALIMKLALFTGMRRGEILKLQWQDVDLQKGFIFLADPKGGQSQKLPLSPAAVEVLKQCPRHKTSLYVFPGRHGGKRATTKRLIDKLKNEAGLPDDFRPLHGLRHVYASTLVESGVDLYRVQKLLTHKSTAMTQRYSHLKDETLRSAAVTAAAAILGGPESKAEKTGTETK
ncbi:MAG: site-specific integrase [Thermodesulfobacteriota bacterium]